MRKYFLVKYLWAALFLGVGPYSNLHGLTIWNGNVTTSVTDDNIDITGNVQLGNGGIPGEQDVCINSVAADITVTPIGGNWTITPFNDGAVNNPITLHINVAAGHTVTFDLATQSLDFVGGLKSFLVSVAGEGNVSFSIGDGQEVSFRSPGPLTPGTYFMVIMDTTAKTPLPQAVKFARASNAGNGNAVINVGLNSVIGFLGTDTALATQTAIMGFDATNNIANTGRLELVVANGGSIAVQSYFTSNVLNTCGGAAPININDIDFTTLAGNRGSFQTLSSSASDWSGFLILNENAILPAFRSNPWLQSPNVVGIQPGFVVGINGSLIINTDTYLDYVGGSGNVSPTPTIPASVLADVFPSNCISPQVNQVVKDRNPSALFIDGHTSNCVTTNRAQIEMFGSSKIYFSSACDSCGLSSNGISADYPFTVNYQLPGQPFNKQLTGPQGYGSIVFDVEGIVDIIGDGTNDQALNILSLFENNVGGSVLINDASTIFKLRPNPWATDINGVYEQYGKACWLVNGRVNIINGVALQQTDEIHEVFDKNVPQQSEASYIGGETWLLNYPNTARPTIAFYGTSTSPSSFLIQTDAALSGVDLLVPSYGSAAQSNSQSNFANFTFFGNGWCIDQGTGRSLIMGTNIGALASDLGTIINRDAHFNVFPEQYQGATAYNILATISTAANNSKVTQNTPANSATIASQYSVHSFYLGWASNISIGTQAQAGASNTQGIDICVGQPYTLLDTPTLNVAGDFISFETQGGIKNVPSTSVETGQGGIFIDKQGLFSISPNYRMNIAAMVALGFNGAVTLPKSQVYFHPAVGVTNSNLNMAATPSQVVIIPAGASFADYTLDWKYTVRNTCVALGYTPYTFPSVPNTCSLTPVVAANITTIPTIQGEVDQFLIKNARLGDEAAILVDGSLGGGIIKELILQNGYDTGVAPTAIVTVTNNAIVGLGRASRYLNTLEGSLVLGVNGITLIADGNSQVFLNDNIVVNNAAPILVGPDFGATTSNILEITSTVPREIRIQNGGVLDLSQFTTANQTLLISGRVTLVFEPGARMVLGGGNLQLIEDATIRLESYLPVVTGVTINSTDVYRVKWSGTGNINLFENSTLSIPSNALLGIESGPSTCSPITSLNMTLQDSGSVFIGSDTDYGGGIQVGNTTSVALGSVTFNLTINGPSAVFNINGQGFFGLGVGIVNKPFGSTLGAPNNWTVAPLLENTAATINILQGQFRHNNINLGSSTHAGLFAIGAASTGYTFNIVANAPNTSLVLGGGNLVQISGQTAPTVLTTNGIINADLSAGILASGDVLRDPSKVAPTFPATATQLFNYLAANPYASQVAKIGEAATTLLGVTVLGFVNGSTIVRQNINGVYGPSGALVNANSSLAVGALGMTLNVSGTATSYAIRP